MQVAASDRSEEGVMVMGVMASLNGSVVWFGVVGGNL